MADSESKVAEDDVESEEDDDASDDDIRTQSEESILQMDYRYKAQFHCVAKVVYLLCTSSTSNYSFAQNNVDT